MFTFHIESGNKLIRDIDGQDPVQVTFMMWSRTKTDDGSISNDGILYDQTGVGCAVREHDLQQLRVMCAKAGVENNIAAPPTKTKSTKGWVRPQACTFDQMRGFAREVVMLEQKKSRMRWCAFFVVSAVFGSVLLLVGLVVISGAVGEYEVRADNGKLAMVKKDSDEILATVQSNEDRDGSDLVDYDRTVEGNDGPWALPSNMLELVRTLSWWEDNKMHVQHVAHIQRHGGDDPKVFIITKAGHEIILYDSNGVDTFDLMMRRWDTSTYTFGPWKEINADGDSDAMGRGRVVINLRRPRMQKSREIDLKEYF